MAPAPAAVCGWASPRASSTRESEILSGAFTAPDWGRGSWGASAPKAASLSLSAVVEFVNVVTGAVSSWQFSSLQLSDLSGHAFLRT